MTDDFEIIRHEPGEPMPEEPPNHTVVVGLTWDPCTRSDVWSGGVVTDSVFRWNNGAYSARWQDVFESATYKDRPWYEIRRREVTWI